MWTTALSSLLVGSTAPWCKPNNEGHQDPKDLRSKIEGISVIGNLSGKCPPMPHRPREVRPYKKGCLRDDGGLESPKKGLICWNGGIRGLPYRLPHDDPTAHFKLVRRTTFHPWCALDD